MTDLLCAWNDTHKLGIDTIRYAQLLEVATFLEVDVPDSYIITPNHPYLIGRNLRLQ